MTNQIIISDISIHKDGQGRYSLNDLHTASGKEDKHQPAFFMRRHETIEMINEISNSAKSQSWKPTISKSGRYGGTYVCKELVYSYAMWISAAFALKVIRAYDRLVSGEVNPKTTTTERTPLRDAVNLLVGKKGLMYPEAYSLIHQRFNVGHIDELPTEQLPKAIEYIHRLALEGEYIPKEDPREITHKRVHKDIDVHNINALAKHYEAIYTAWKVELYPALRSIDSPIAGRLCDRFKDGYAFLRYLQESLNGKHSALIN